MIINCEFCNKEFKTCIANIKRGKGKYCSLNCFHEQCKSKRIKKNCLNCNKELNFKPTKAYLNCCGRKCSIEYKLNYPYNMDMIKDEKLLCYRCKNYLPFENFYSTKGTSLSSKRRNKMKNCKQCEIKVGKEQSNKRLSTIEGCIKEIFKRSRSSCKTKLKKGRIVDFNLTVEYLLELYKSQKGLCSLSGISLGLTGTYNLKGVSIDRIDSSKGYIKGNVQLVCWVVNQMKNDLENNELIDWCNKISEYNKIREKITEEDEYLVEF